MVTRSKFNDAASTDSVNIDIPGNYYTFIPPSISHFFLFSFLVINCLFFSYLISLSFILYPFTSLFISNVSEESDYHFISGPLLTDTLPTGILNRIVYEASLTVNQTEIHNKTSDTLELKGQTEYNCTTKIDIDIGQSEKVKAIRNI